MVLAEQVAVAAMEATVVLAEQVAVAVMEATVDPEGLVVEKEMGSALMNRKTASSGLPITTVRASQPTETAPGKPMSPKLVPIVVAPALTTEAAVVEAAEEKAA